jgi:hypothetical protein
MTETTTDAGPLTTLAMKFMRAEQESDRDYRDILPERAGKRGAIRWLPHAENYEHGEGFVTITMDRDTTTYHVTAYPTAVGRGFMLTKLGGKATAKKSESYAVECVGVGDNATGHCECDGWRFTKHCKHFDSVATLLMNSWL